LEGGKLNGSNNKKKEKRKTKTLGTASWGLNHLFGGVFGVERRLPQGHVRLLALELQKGKKEREKESGSEAAHTRIPKPKRKGRSSNQQTDGNFFKKTKQREKAPD